MVSASLSEEDGSTSQASPIDANQSGDSIANSSFGGDEPGTSGTTGSGSTAATLTIGQQKATAILPEVHPVTGEWTSTQH